MKNIALSFIIVLITVVPSYSWENKRTHPRISEFTAQKYFGPDFMDQAINGKRAREWVRDGAELEDAGSSWQFMNGTARSLNHFHNPTRSNLGEAGRGDYKGDTGLKILMAKTCTG